MGSSMQDRLKGVIKSMIYYTVQNQIQNKQAQNIVSFIFLYITYYWLNFINNTNASQTGKGKIAAQQLLLLYRIE